MWALPHIVDGTPCLHPTVNCLESIYRGVARKIIRESRNAINPTSHPSPSPPVNVASIQELPLGQSLQLVPEADGYPVLHSICRSNVKPKCGNNTFLVSPRFYVVPLFHLSSYRLQTVIGPCSATYCKPAKQYLSLEVGLASLYPL